MQTQPNLLIHEKSPYLKQHAYNPVAWHPWSDRAFARAIKENRLIFLSIGYSSCHWCHVMERESFENQDVADILNQGFVCIKVDREERPDIDEAYMGVCHVLSGQCGWPLSIFMTPDKKPFFAASYLPPTTKYQHPGLTELASAFTAMWQEDSSRILDGARDIALHLQQAADATDVSTPLHPASVQQCFADLERSFDRQNGGFGKAPKFPLPNALGFLFSFHTQTGNTRALEMARRSLIAMRLGGIWDHVGFGFHRYATDQAWLVPHFEKMLYDQAMLVLVYLQGVQCTKDPLFAQTAREILAFVLDDLTGEEMGFFSALDADSEGEEGRYYVWSDEEFRELAGDTAEAWASRFGVEPGGNFLDEATRERVGTNILSLSEPLGPGMAHGFIELRLRLLARRHGRIAPFRDEKVLTDWNGLMLVALARAARVLGDKGYAHAAEAKTSWLLQTMLTPEGRLLHRYCEGDVAVQGLATDYAFFVWGLIEVYQAVFDPVLLEHALALQKVLDTGFWDEEQQCYRLAGVLDDGLPVGPRSFHDGPTPDYNSVSLHNLLNLAGLTGDVQYSERASALVEGLGPQAADQPGMVPWFMAGAAILFRGSREIVIVGDRNERGTRELLAEINARYLPGTVVHLKDAGSEASLARVAPYTDEMQMLEGQATAYVCSGHACRKPVNSREELAGLLEERIGC